MSKLSVSTSIHFIFHFCHTDAKFFRKLLPRIILFIDKFIKLMGSVPQNHMLFVLALHHSSTPCSRCQHCVSSELHVSPSFTGLRASLWCTDSSRSHTSPCGLYRDSWARPHTNEPRPRAGVVWTQRNWTSFHQQVTELPALYRTWTSELSSQEVNTDSYPKSPKFSQHPPVLFISDPFSCCAPNGLFPSGIPTKTLWAILVTHTLAACSTHLLLPCWASSTSHESPRCAIFSDSKSQTYIRDVPGVSRHTLMSRGGKK